MHKKKIKCCHCGNVYCWEETTVDIGNTCARCRDQSYDGIEMMDDLVNYGSNKWKDKKEDKDRRKDTHDKHDRNEWIHELYELFNGKFEGRRITIFTEDGTQTNGSVDEVKKDFVKLVSTEVPVQPVNSGWFTYHKPVKVKNNHNQVLKTFDKYFLRLDSIVGFGEPADYGEYPCYEAGYSADEEELDEE